MPISSSDARRRSRLKCGANLENGFDRHINYQCHVVVRQHLDVVIEAALTMPKSPDPQRRVGGHEAIMALLDAEVPHETTANSGILALGCLSLPPIVSLALGR